MAPKRGPNGPPGSPANDALGNPQTALREVLQTALREVLQTAFRETLQTTSREVLQRRPSGASEPGTRGPGPAAALARDGRSPFYSVAENIFLLFE